MQGKSAIEKMHKQQGKTQAWEDCEAKPFEFRSDHRWTVAVAKSDNCDIRRDVL